MQSARWLSAASMCCCWWYLWKILDNIGLGLRVQVLQHHACLVCCLGQEWPRALRLLLPFLRDLSLQPLRNACDLCQLLCQCNTYPRCTSHAFPRSMHFAIITSKPQPVRLGFSLTEVHPLLLGKLNGGSGRGIATRPQSLWFFGGAKLCALWLVDDASSLQQQTSALAELLYTLQDAGGGGPEGNRSPVQNGTPIGILCHGPVVGISERVYPSSTARLT
mmetsp:Transcript_11725/g.21317  ORF Transcript_11725/g.21317 Transcript_11725/m.21317 type:complete len:220 (+) Transcript_11725:538-1197(+)